VKQPKLGIVSSGQTASRDGDRITCSFSRLKHVNDPNNGVYPIDNTTQYYILMARGQLSGGQHQLSLLLLLLLLEMQRL